MQLVMWWRAAVLCTLLGMAWAASAQGLPPIKEFYFDNDPAAVPMVAVEVDAADLVDQLMRQRTRGRRAVEATVQLAGVAAAQGRDDLARSLSAEALEATQPGTLGGRSARWNIGWLLYRQGNVTQALQMWQQAHDGSRSAPSWVPPTLALALWRDGRQDDAVHWFAAAVRTEPQLWSDPANFAQLLPDWKADERDTLAQVHAAWVANPPAWK